MASAPRWEKGGETDSPPDLVRLFDETLPRLYGYFRARVGGDRATAEDLTSETWLAAARMLRTGGAEIGEPVAWLFGIARHKLIDHYRSRERDPLAGSFPLGEEEDLGRRGDRSDRLEAAPTPDGDLERIAERDELIAALAQLPAGQRLALVLHYADGLSVAETAFALDRSQHAVESLLARGRRSLRAVLTDLETRP